MTTHLTLSKQLTPGIRVNQFGKNILSTNTISPYLKTISGSSWRKSDYSFSTSLSDVSYGDGYFMVAGGSKAYYTKDGKSFNELNLPISASFVAYGNGRWMFASGVSGSAFNWAYTTDYGTFTTGTRDVGARSAANNALTFEASMGIFTYATWSQSNYALVAYSSGTSWSNGPVLPNYNNNIGWGHQSGNGYVYVGYYADNVIYYSTSPTLATWTQLSVPGDIGYTRDAVNPNNGRWTFGINSTESGFGGKYATGVNASSVQYTYHLQPYGATMYGAYIGGNTWMHPTTGSGGYVATTTTPENNSSWSYYVSPSGTTTLRVAGDQSQGYFVAGITSTGFWTAIT